MPYIHDGHEDDRKHQGNPTTFMYFGQGGCNVEALDGPKEKEEAQSNKNALLPHNYHDQEHKACCDKHHCDHCKTWCPQKSEELK